MNWIASTLGSSIGKKLMMALTGLAFIGFLAAHLAGNLTIYGGKGAFNAYAEKLHTLGPLLAVMELGLAAFALVHITTGLWLFIQNRRARPVRYTLDRSRGGRTLGSRTMPYTGLIILAFVALHLTNFTFRDKTGTTIYDIVAAAFSSPWTVLLYAAAMIVLGLHVRHGFWSAFQTIGANHPKYMPAIEVLSVALGVVVALGFGLIPIVVMART
jgi:succinate dehydrogenase / fumarate reductase cytochrome b subunit